MDAANHDGAADPTNAILDLLRGVRRHQFKPPTFDGTTDIELFIRQFSDVRDANEWGAAATLLHLRSCLQDDAVDSGTGETSDEIFANLRARFGLTERQARDRLSALHRAPEQSLQALGLESERLVAVAYPGVKANVRTTLAIDTFTRALDDRNLKRHLLVAGANTLTDTIRRAEEFLEIGKPEQKGEKAIKLAAADVHPGKSAAANQEQRPSQLDSILQRLEQLTTKNDCSEPTK
jgi:hypothetical protein